MRPQFSVKNRLPRGGNRCDFCACHFVYKLYACHNFEWNARAIFDRPKTAGRWGACETCADRIEDKDWGGLARRVMREVKRRAGVTPRELAFLRRDLVLMYGALSVNLIPGQVLTVYQPHYRKVNVSDVALPKGAA
jgi:hypothetical protein